MTARAELATHQVTDLHGRSVTRVHTLRSQAPLVLRPVQPQRFEPLIHQAAHVARVALASGAAGPLGGDMLELKIHVGAASTLLLSEISATLLLPGARGGRSYMRIRIRVDDGATLVWLQEPVIAARDCDHVHDIRIDLAPTARVFLRDELLLGRHREAPGDLLQNMRISRGGAALFHQQLRFGPAGHGATSPAVLGAHKCVATALAVDPLWQDAKPQARLFAHNAALLPLHGPAVMLSALAADTPTLRRRIRQGMAALGAPWMPPDDGDGDSDSGDADANSHRRAATNALS